MARLGQLGIIAAGGFEVFQSDRPLVALQGESRNVQLPESEQGGNLRLIAAIPPVALQATQHILQTDQSRPARRDMTFGERPAVFGEFVLDACRNRKIVSLES